MTYLTNEDVRDDIFEAIAIIFGLNILDFSQIELGYMNLNWKIKTDDYS
ncbi:hypothetical protein [Viridibacillus arvi]|nr:hypothetical protein [Viridibacillus sp. JNUCC-6]QOV12221.1 hypothetical protein JNUCC6_05500 [Viridibacillus sp. JNUCC-6]